LSVIGYLVCVADREILAVGKLVAPDGMTPALLSVTAAETNLVNRALRRFLAQHLGHTLMVVGDDALHEIPAFETERYREIGGDATGDIAFEEYLKNYPA
jgi:hypothetical protein